jgi:hypothetical protein
MNSTVTVTEVSQVRINRDIIRRFAHSGDLPMGDAEQIGDELVRFLLLCATSGRSLAPSPIIDDLWHHFILHTQDYSEWCSKTLGVFIHHVPCDGDSTDAYDQTRELLAQRFGPVSDRFWPPLTASKCSKCGGKCRT